MNIRSFNKVKEEKKRMNHQSNKGWAFVLTLAMVFTTLFGGFSLLGVKGIVGEAYAAGISWTDGTALGDTVISNGDIVTVTGTVTLSGTITISGSAIITGSGIIKQTSSRNMIHITAGNALTISGITLDMNSKEYYGVCILGGQLNMSGSAEIKNSNETGVYIYPTSPKGVFNMMDNAKISDCTGGDGGGIYNTGIVTMSRNAEISNCIATYRGGGGLLQDSGTFNMLDNAKITSCSAAVLNQVNRGGGGAWIAGTINIDGGTIENCHSNTTGGGVMLAGTHTVNVSGSAKVVNNFIDGTATSNNIQVKSGTYVQITGSGLTAGASLGISSTSSPTGYSSVSVVTGSATHAVSGADAVFFHADSSAHFITYSSIVADNALLLVANGWTPQTKNNTPTAIFDASDMMLSNLTTDMKYSINGGSTWLSVYASSISISGATTSDGIQIKTPGNSSLNTLDSDVQMITLTKAATPSVATFTATNPSTIGATGTIAGITAVMEYSTDGGSSWTNGGSTLSNLAGGTTVLVRIKGSGTILASDSCSLTINAYVPSAEATPTADYEASTMTLSNISSSMKYSVDGGASYTNITSDGNITISGVTAANGIKVYKAGNGTTTTNSGIQTITITKAAAPAAAAFTVSQPTALGETGTIAGITAAMEYSTDSGSSWTYGGSTLSNLAGGTTCLIRVKASGTVLASNNCSITINTFGGTDIYTISADTILMNFGSLTEGYASAPASQTVTVTNTGNQTITLTEPAITNVSSNYNIGNLSSTTLATGSAVTFTVQPKTGLATGTYNETIDIEGSGGATTSVSAQFGVTAADSSSSGDSSHGRRTTTGTVADTVSVSVNGQLQAAGTVSTSKVGNQTVTTVTVDDTKIQEMIKAEANKSTVSIPISGSANIGQGILNGQTVKDMEKKESVLEIKTASATYTLPASEIDIDSVSSQFGQTVELKAIQVSVKIAEPSDNIAKVVQDTANKNNYQVVVKPVDFEITCTSGSKTVTVSKFNSYVDRMVAIPDGTDPSKITTAIVLNSDGTFYHVPTAIVQIDGKYYAKINSLTNSTYSVIYNPVAFADVAKHWAKDSIDNMGSRLIISGVGGNNFDPNRDITRAEFAAIMVRALGLAPDASQNTFSDVSDSKWYSGYVGTAASYGIITGTDVDTFAPNAKITREQAMTMVARAMAITGLDATAAGMDASAALAGYADTAKISSYAQAGITACLNTGVVTGKTADTISPKNNITRAEVAVIIERLLKKSELI